MTLLVASILPHINAILTTNSPPLQAPDNTNAQTRDSEGEYSKYPNTRLEGNEKSLHLRHCDGFWIAGEALRSRRGEERDDKSATEPLMHYTVRLFSGIGKNTYYWWHPRIPFGTQ